MIHKVIQPSLHLQPFIKDYLLLHYEFSKQSVVPVKPFPASTRHCLVFYIIGGITSMDINTGQSHNYPNISVNASQISRFNFYPSPHFYMLEINFHPYALARFLRLPMAEFIDKRIDAEAILNPEVRQVRQRMMNANSYEDIITTAEHYLWARIQQLKTDSHPIDKVIGIMANNAFCGSTEQMASLACLSVSQFERRFAQQIGITPKLFARISRFSKAYQIKDHNPGANWLSIALETGYYDYQHLVKDFRQFAGATPASLLAAQAGAPERILGIG